LHTLVAVVVEQKAQQMALAVLVAAVLVAVTLELQTQVAVVAEELAQAAQEAQAS
jgi:hypothetical protein